MKLQRDAVIRELRERQNFREQRRAKYLDQRTKYGQLKPSNQKGTSGQRRAKQKV